MAEVFNQTLIIPEKLGKKIKELRISLQLSQADVCADFMSLRTLQKIEKGETTPTFEILLHIANKLHIELFELVLSSRIPFYLNYQLPSLTEFVHSDFENNAHLSQTELATIFEDLKMFSDVKLPYNESVRIETISTLIMAFMHKNRDSAAKILGEYVENFTFNPESNPSENEVFQISAYLRLMTDRTLVDAYIAKLALFPQYYYHPTIAYNLILIYYRRQDWQTMLTIARATLQHLDQETIETMVPYLYCQAGIAHHHLGDTARGGQVFDKGLELLNLLRQKDGFKIMLLQAQKDNISINYVQYQQVIF